MRLATWNVNSIRQRQGHVERWLGKDQPDVLVAMTPAGLKMNVGAWKAGGLIIADSGEHELEQFIFKGTSDIQQMMVSLWSPVLDKARARGELRSDVTNEDAVEWIRNQHATLSVRDDYDEAKQRQILSRFLVPSLMIRRPRP